jgi:hypothetical protein
MTTGPVRIVAGPHILTQNTGDGMVIVNTTTASYIDLDEVGADMWQALTKHSDVDAAVQALLEIYEADADQVASDLSDLVRRLEDLGLVECLEEIAEDTDLDGDAAVLRAATCVPAVVDLYLDLLANTLCGIPQGDNHLGRRFFGLDVPDENSGVYSMIGVPRMRNIRALIEKALEEDIPGDVMECGVWRGGATVFMRGVLAAHGIHDRNVWVADAFAGLPAANPDQPLDVAEWGRRKGFFRATQDEVVAAFTTFGLLDERVRFVLGWFQDSLPTAPIEQLAVLRIDADLYDSTASVLRNLYAKVAPGGFIIVDDYYFASCRQAVSDFLAEHDPDVEIHFADWTAVWWRKSG